MPLPLTLPMPLAHSLPLPLAHYSDGTAAAGSLCIRVLLSGLVVLLLWLLLWLLILLLLVLLLLLRWGNQGGARGLPTALALPLVHRWQSGGRHG